MAKPQTPSRKVRTEGMSIRAYGRRRGCSDTAVRKHIASGLLKPAVLADGSIDPDKADEILARGRTRAADNPPDLAVARRRKLAAECRLLADELADLESECVTGEMLDAFLARAARAVISHLPPIVAAVPALAGKEPSVVAASLHDIVFDVLTAVSTQPIAGEDSAADDAAGYNLDRLDITELAGLKADLQARKLEVVRKIAHGDLVRFMPAIDEFGQRLSNLRAGLLALPTKSAAQVSAMRPDASIAFVRSLLVEAVGKLEGRGVTLAPLLATLDASTPEDVGQALLAISPETDQ